MAPGEESMRDGVISNINNQAEDAVAADVRAAIARCSARGGAFKRVADERLGPVVSLIETVGSELKKARDAATGVLEAVNAARKSATARIEQAHDALWEAIGKPSSDAAMSLLFPGGAAYYSDGSVDELPDRMDLLGGLLEAGVHPKVAPERAKEIAKDVRAAARTLREAVDAARMPRARVRLLERAVLVVAESARAELSSLGKRLAAEGESQDDIDSVLAPRATDGAAPPVPPGGLKLA
jgi:hypothetical protein